METVEKPQVSRRNFLAALGAGAGAATLGLAACTKEPIPEPVDGDGMIRPGLPPAQPDPENMFGVDKNVNMSTIDGFIASGATDGAVKIDLRLVDDPARYEAIGGDSKLSMMLEGFTIVPYPYMGTLQTLPVEGAYTGPCLYAVTWDDAGNVASAIPNYTQAPDLLAELFPKDKPILLMCGGGGYAGMMRKLLIHLGWDSEKIYNLGGMWDYVGDYPVQLISYADRTQPEYYLWRAKMPVIDFGTLR